MTEQGRSGAALRLRELLERLWGRLERLAATSEGAMITAELEIDAAYGPLRLGRDPEGLRHLLVPIGPGDRVDDDLRSAGVHLTTRTLLQGDDLPVRYADVACKRHDLTGTFTGLVADLAGLIAAEPSEAPSLVTRTLHAWRLLLGGTAKRWTTPRLAGLFAELLVLEDLLSRGAGAVGAWQGPLGSPHDFRGVHHAVEIKGTLSSEGRVVHIHGVEQLERPVDGTLALGWFRLTESNTRDARSIFDVLTACREKTDDLSSLETRLIALGLPQGDAEFAVRTRFSVVEQRWYEVTEDFPRIVPESFVGSTTPPGVREVQYSVDLDAVSAATDSDSVLDRLGGDL